MRTGAARAIDDQVVRAGGSDDHLVAVTVHPSRDLAPVLAQESRPPRHRPRLMRTLGAYLERTPVLLEIEDLEVVSCLHPG